MWIKATGSTQPVFRRFQTRCGHSKRLQSSYFHRLHRMCRQSFAKHACSLPYAMRPLVEAQLDKLVQEGILTPIQHTDCSRTDRASNES